MTHKRHITLLFSMFFTIAALHAQFNDPRETFSISATVDGATNTDYHWESRDNERLEDGRMKHGVNARIRANVKLLGNQLYSLSFSPFYNFSNKELRASKAIVSQPFNLPTSHHHYGGSLTASYNTIAFHKPLTLMATGTGNFSRYGYENASGMLGGIFSITRNQKTYLAVGAMYLIGTSVSWPLYPVIIYTHRFDNRWSINCLETNNYLYYQASPAVRCAVGMELETDKIYLRPKTDDLPPKMEISQVSERFGFFATVQASKEISLNFGTGITVPFYGRLRQSGHNHTYMTMHDHVKPFVKMNVKYSLRK